MYMYCRLCQKYNVKARNESVVWSMGGCRTRRLDRVVAHETSEQHQQAFKLETCAQLGISTGHLY